MLAWLAGGELSKYTISKGEIYLHIVFLLLVSSSARSERKSRTLSLNLSFNRAAAIFYAARDRFCCSYFFG
jgi:hypothetical protein